MKVTADCRSVWIVENRRGNGARFPRLNVIIVSKQRIDWQIWFLVPDWSKNHYAVFVNFFCVFVGFQTWKFFSLKRKQNIRGKLFLKLSKHQDGRNFAFKSFFDATSSVFWAILGATLTYRTLRVAKIPRTWPNLERRAARTFTEFHWNVRMACHWSTLLALKRIKTDGVKVLPHNLLIHWLEKMLRKDR